MWRACSSGIFISPGRGKHTDLDGTMAAERHPGRMRIDRSWLLTGSLSSPDVLVLLAPPNASSHEAFPLKQKHGLGTNSTVVRSNRARPPLTRD
jgi:hypothetical protein